MTNTGQLNVGVIGLGVGKQHIAGYEKDSRCKVVALCDKSWQKLEDVKSRLKHCRYTQDPTELLTDKSIDVISIASYDDVHAEQIVLAAQNGKHVFVEKPLCLNQSEFDDIFNALNEHSEIKLSSNLILRKTRRFIDLRTKIRQGKLGAIYYVDGDYDFGRLEKITDGWRSDIPHYSVVHGGAIHLIDLLLWCTGNSIQEVFSYGTNICTQDTKYRNSDLVAALLKFDNGLVGKVTANFGCMIPHHHKLSFYGTKGTFTQGHTDAFYSFSRDPKKNFHLLNEPYPGIHKGDMVPAFIASILDGTKPDVAAQEVLDSMAVSLAIEASLFSGKPETVRYRILAPTDSKRLIE